MGQVAASSVVCGPPHTTSPSKTHQAHMCHTCKTFSSCLPPPAPIHYHQCLAFCSLHYHRVLCLSIPQALHAFCTPINSSFLCWDVLFAAACATTSLTPFCLYQHFLPPPPTLLPSWPACITFYVALYCPFLPSCVPVLLTCTTPSFLVPTAYLAFLLPTPTPCLCMYTHLPLVPRLTTAISCLPHLPAYAYVCASFFPALPLPFPATSVIYIQRQEGGEVSVMCQEEGQSEKETGTV